MKRVKRTQYQKISAHRQIYSDDPVSEREGTADEYTLWLEPREKDAQLLQNIIDDFSLPCHTPKFTPHITLIGGLHGNVATIEKHAETLATACPTLIISFTKVDMLSTYFQSLFLACKKTNTLMNLNARAQDLFAKSYIYTPHMSLLYGTVPRDVKKELATRTPKTLINSFSCPISILSLWHARGHVHEWKKIQENTLDS